MASQTPNLLKPGDPLGPYRVKREVAEGNGEKNLQNQDLVNPLAL
jgi:hypothetical protein